MGKFFNSDKHREDNFDYEDARRDLFDAGVDPDYLDYRNREKRDSFLREQGFNPRTYGSTYEPDISSDRSSGSSFFDRIFSDDSFENSSSYDPFANDYSSDDPFGNEFDTSDPFADEFSSDDIFGNTSDSDDSSDDYFPVRTSSGRKHSDKPFKIVPAADRPDLPDYIKNARSCEKINAKRYSENYVKKDLKDISVKDLRPAYDLMPVYSKGIKFDNIRRTFTYGENIKPFACPIFLSIGVLLYNSDVNKTYAQFKFRNASLVDITGCLIDIKPIDCYGNVIRGTYRKEYKDYSVIRGDFFGQDELIELPNRTWKFELEILKVYYKEEGTVPWTYFEGFGWEKVPEMKLEYFDKYGPIR